MAESLRETIEDIQKKLRANAYQNEEHVRLSLVARVVQALGWDIWNPREVNTEFATTPDEDKTKVDMALFAVANYPSVLIEVKAVGKMEGKIADFELQVRNYNRDITVQFAIITDGRQWRFYYVKGDGKFSDKLFDRVDLLEMDTIRLERVFEANLSKTEIRSGNTENDAKRKLNVSQKQEAMANSFQEAQDKTENEPFPTLPDALVLVMRHKGFKITRPEAVEYIRSRKDGSNRTVQSPLTVQPTSMNLPQTPQVTSVLPSSFHLDGVVFNFQSPTEIVTTVAEYLIQKNLLNSETVPVLLYKNWAAVNQEPRHPDGKSPQRKRQLSNGLWLALVNDKYCLDEAKDLLKHFGLDDVLSLD